MKKEEANYISTEKLEEILLAQITPPLPINFERNLMHKAQEIVACKTPETTQKKPSLQSFKTDFILFFTELWNNFRVESRPMLAAALLLGFFIGNQLTDLYIWSETEDDYFGEFEIASRLDYLAATPINSIGDFLLFGE